MMRSAAAARRWHGADIRAFKSPAAAQAAPLSARWRVATAAAVAVKSTSSGGPLQPVDSVSSHRQGSPRAPACGARPAVPADDTAGGSDTYLGMPPPPRAVPVKPGEIRSQPGGPAQAGAGADELGSRPRGWGVVRLAVRPEESGPAAGTAHPESAAIPAQAVAPEATGRRGSVQGHGELGTGERMTDANPDGHADSTAAVAAAKGSAGDRPPDAVHGKARLWRVAASKHSAATARQHKRVQRTPPEHR